MKIKTGLTTPLEIAVIDGKNIFDILGISEWKRGQKIEST